MAFILSDSHPLGKVKHYFVRREYQGRGLQHFHCMIWVEGAPIIGKFTDDEIANFISKYISCTIPEKTAFPTLFKKVITYQKHKHSKYCQRFKQSKDKKKKFSVCRFGFGRKITPNFILHSVAESILGRRKLRKTRLYDLPRTTEEANINDYNPACLLAWCGNMDIQFIGEASEVLQQYILKYALKSEKSNTGDFREFLQNRSAASNLWSLGMQALSNRECGALEAADTLLQLPLFETDRQTVIRWVDVSMNRARKVKTKQQLDNMHDDADNIFCPNWVDVYYPQRPEEIKNICLYDFVRWYDLINNKPKSETVQYFIYGERYLRLRQHPYLINHYKYNVKKEPESYYHSLLLLFKPWKNHGELMYGMDTYRDAFLSCADELEHMHKYHENLQQIVRAREEVEKEVANLIENEENSININRNENENEHEIVGFEVQIGNELEEIDTRVQKLNDMPIEDQINQLNIDQKRIFDEVVRYVTRYCTEWDAAAKANASNLKDPRLIPNNVMRKFVSGVGGTGKSFLINILRRHIPNLTKKKVVVAAPTGIAALNVNGLTLHRLLQLPIEHEGKCKYRPLSNDKLANIRYDLKDVALLIIDEISMVSNICFACCNIRLCEIFNTIQEEDGYFGKINILLFGDLLQLQPVGEASFAGIPTAIRIIWFISSRKFVDKIILL
ncbi:uncharacterized protein LOC114327696 [Diabrotica virgifera virgifera]|uniref:ATP-dependent DNA helicase n=1 Tax=Diabrotica virgifera virgifera TaxID=50390 RepID=A0ABM5IGE1_DIAVI|nr:uncharacterized protein LOC114327696 [Diabrotica virgifera virgifera]